MGRGCREILGLDEVTRMGPCDGISVLPRRGRETRDQTPGGQEGPLPGTDRAKALTVGSLQSCGKAACVRRVWRFTSAASLDASPCTSQPSLKPLGNHTPRTSLASPPAVYPHGSLQASLPFSGKTSALLGILETRVKICLSKPKEKCQIVS